MAEVLQEEAESPHIWLVHPVDLARQAMGGSVKLARDLFFRTLRDGIEGTLWGVGSSRAGPLEGATQRYRRVSRTDRLLDWTIHLWARCAFTKPPPGTIVQTFRVDFLLPFVLFHPSIRTVAILDRSLTYLSTEFRLLRGVLTRAFRLVESFVLRRVDRVVTDEVSAAYYRRLYPWIEAKLRIRSTGPVDLERFANRPAKEEARAVLGIPPRSVVVVFIGRLEAVKNPELLLAAVRELGKKVPNVCLLVAGRGSHLGRLERASREVGPLEIRLLGEQPYDRIPTILAASDVLALTSRMEGSPTVVREALAARVPVVTTDVGDVRSVIRHPSLGRISSANAEKFAQDLEAVLGRTRSRVDAKHFQSVSEAYSMEGFCAFMGRVYAEVAEEAGHEPGFRQPVAAVET